MLGIVFAGCLVVLGAKAFTESGVPLTRNTSVKGATGKVVGTVCILLGLLWALLMILSF
jgi:hypothetical protein